MRNEIKTDSPELTVIETVLLELIGKQLAIEKSFVQTILDNTDDLTKLMYAANLLQGVRRSGILNDLKERFWDQASVSTLQKIVNEEKFSNKYSWADGFIITKDVIRTFRSYDNFKSTDPKAVIAKKLGATIVM